MLCSCATPADRAGGLAEQHGYQRLVLTGNPFSHVAYFKPGEAGRSLHVYVEHDGTPWTSKAGPAADPTPRSLRMLELMAGDASPALYLGRPCYFGMAPVPPCEPIWWTHRRYSAEVVQSMEAALERFLRAHAEFETLELYGYSGGGVIAVLMARNNPSIRRLVTVGAPLDTDAWAQLHRFSPLDGSLNPIRQGPLPSTVTQLHFAGSGDDVVPPYLVRSFAVGQPAAQFVEIPGFDHYCCWDAIWATTVLGQ